MMATFLTSLAYRLGWSVTQGSMPSHPVTVQNALLGLSSAVLCMTEPKARRIEKRLSTPRLQSSIRSATKSCQCLPRSMALSSNW
ncbi:hypothetical protein B0H14DRAFT_2668031 [Mycena olivaceomarginata]|nr:hypothetical protein B0H14DRAFT_3056599 [Mycena olivaceomarginata]KAJ7738270.1 hypothetical protein B0H14DRAFT_2992343 [Mycena olivaceomarginata]KAJ7748848.1 hypothetical protein B0H14DRAFT_2983181 [Mycena olivaceomarginata]KAJ7790240.1 hypothetical protein B0H14DRAFT_2940827 [Mycena olivaceomarginata]KAJ7797769.1 hypothetical protein B0H14DRAFT_2909726 [Mycena olivaceomarginata]